MIAAIRRWFAEQRAYHTACQERARTEARERARLTGCWVGENSYRLPITSDVINTTKIYGIGVEGANVLIRMWGDPTIIPCASHNEAEAVRNNIAHIIDAVRGRSDVWGSKQHVDWYSAPRSGGYAGTGGGGGY
jgi:hypothetical protein